MEIATKDLWERVDALEDGRGFVDRSNDHTLVVRGADARRWLGDLVTADVASLEPGSSRRSLLLTATGRIRADLWITRIDQDAFVVLQAIDQPEPVEDVLRPYVLSSAVALEDATGRRSTRAFPGPGEIVTVPRGHLRARKRTTAGHDGAVLVDEPSYEVWRIGRGDPRMGADFEAGALPSEARSDGLIDLRKGCFLGQESVARVRNLGHPSTILMHLRSDAVVDTGARVLAAGEPVGWVTSAAPLRGGGSSLIARVAWRARDADLLGAKGSPLSTVPD